MGLSKTKVVYIWAIRRMPAIVVSISPVSPSVHLDLDLDSDPVGDLP